VDIELGVILVGLLRLHALPDQMDHILVAHLIKNPITRHEYEVVVVADLEGGDVGLCYDYMGVPLELDHLCLDVPKGPRHRQPPWKHPVRPQYDLLSTLARVAVLDHAGVLIDLPPILHDPLQLLLLSRLMIICEGENFFTPISGHDDPAVPHIGHIAHLIDDQDDDGARAGPVYVSDFFFLLLSELQEEPFCLPEAPPDRTDRVLWEIVVLNDELVEVVPEELCALAAAMAIIDPEEGALGPAVLLHVLAFGLHYVQNDGHPILIIVPNDALVGVGSVGGDDAVPLAGVLGWLIVLQQETLLLDARKLLPQTLEQLPTIVPPALSRLLPHLSIPRLDTEVVVADVVGVGDEFLAGVEVGRVPGLLQEALPLHVLVLEHRLWHRIIAPRDRRLLLLRC